MNVRRVVLSSVLIGALLASCSDSTISGGNTSSSAATTTSAESTPTTAAPAPTSTSTTVAASTTGSTSTIPAVRGLDLSADGLGGESFGAESTGVISYVESILGAPTNDTGWINPASAGAACPGSEIRFVWWNDLSLFFTDQSAVASGLRHFASYSYGPAAGEYINPYGLTVEGGIAIGDTVDELLAVYPDALISSDEEFDGSSFHIVEGLTGFLTGPTGADTITTFVGGFGCGE